MLIGTEIADLVELDSNLPILLAAAEPLHAPYRAAFAILDLEKRLQVASADEMAHASVCCHHLLLRRGTS